MFWKRFCVLGAVLTAAVCLSACGGSSSPRVAITPSASIVDGGDAVTLTATVTNDKNSDGVTWSVSGGGTLSSETTSSATYTAPTATSAAQTITITATSKADTGKTGTTTLTVPAAPSITTTSTNLAGTVGTAYSVTLAGSGGISPYTWSASDLPSCLTMTSAGVLSGTVTASCAGAYTPTFKLTDSGKDTALTATSQLNLVLAAATPISFTTSSTLPAGSYNSAYSASTVATGGAGTLTYTVTSGSLPAGLTFSNGSITGTPTAVGTYAITVKAADSYGDATSKAFSITVSYLAISITTGSTLPTGNVGSTYSQALAATGGTGTYSWTVPSSSDVTCLASRGLQLTAAGVLTSNAAALTSGETGTCSFGVQVADNASTPNTATASFSVTVSNFAISTTTLSPSFATTGSAYSAPVIVSGGTAPYTWTVLSGSLPTGLSLGSGTTANNTISGTVSSSATLGDYTFTVKVADHAGLTATKQYTLSVYAPLTVNSSALNLSTTVNQSYSGSLVASGGVASTYTWTVTGLSDGLSYTANNNTLTISGTPTTAASVTFSATVTDGTNTVGPTSYTITVNPVATLTVTLNDVPQGMVGMPYTYSGVSVSGGTAPYTVTYTGAPDGLANGTTSDNANFLVGTPTSLGTTTVTVKVTDSTTPTAQYGTTTFNLPVVAKTVGNHNSYLNGQYACSLQQYWDGGVTGGDSSSTLYRGGSVFAIAVDGSGSITSGEMDFSSPESGYSDASTLGSLSGTYAVGSDNRGYLLIKVGSTGSGVLALAGGNLNSSTQFSEFAITSMDDAGTNSSGQHGSGHCYKQTTTALSGIWPTGGYVFNLTGENSSGEPQAMVGSLQFTAGTSSTAGSITGVVDMVEYLTTDFGLSLTGTTSKGTGTDSFGRITMAIGPSASEEDSMVAYLTNNTKGQILLLDTQAHNGTSHADFNIGEARKQVSANIAASHPFKGSGVLYIEGTEDTSSSLTYKAQVYQFTGSSSANSITLNSGIKNTNGTFTKDKEDVIGQTMAYTVVTSTGRVSITGDTGIHFYLYDTGSAAVLFAEGTSGTDVQNMTGWIEPQTAPTSGTWAISNFAASYFMYRIENGDYNKDSQTSVFTLSSSGDISNYASDDGGQNWASWDESLTNQSGSAVTATVALDSTDGTYGLFDMQTSASTTPDSYCFAVSVDSATTSSTKGKFLCLDASSSSPVVNVIQE